MNEMSWKPKEWRRLDNRFDAIRIRQFGQPTQKEKKKAIFDEEDKSTHGDKTTLNKKKKKEEERGRPRWISSLWNISLASVSKTKHARVVEKQFTVDKIFRMRWRVSGPVVPNCLPNVTFYRRDLVLVTIFFVMSTVHPNIAQLRKNNHIMLPNVRQQVVQFSSLPSSLCKTNS